MLKFSFVRSFVGFLHRSLLQWVSPSRCFVRSWVIKTLKDASVRDKSCFSLSTWRVAAGQVEPSAVVRQMKQISLSCPLIVCPVTQCSAQKFSLVHFKCETKSSTRKGSSNVSPPLIELPHRKFIFANFDLLSFTIEILLSFRAIDKHCKFSSFFLLFSRNCLLVSSHHI